MGKTVRFGVSMDSDLLGGFDGLLKRIGYGSRSEAIRDIIRERLVEQEWQEVDRETVGTITIVYSHEMRELTRILTFLQHQYHRQIVSTMHIHLDEHNCLEVLVVRGRSKEIEDIAQRLISTRGVKHGKLTATTTGRELV